MVMLRIATGQSESLFRSVWEANQENSVRENATLVLRANGNLFLADADGPVAWQSRTANRGAVGFKLWPKDNTVLHDSKGNFVRQSFGSPMDTFLMGRS